MSDYNVAQRRPEYMGQTAEQVITKAKSQLMDSATGMTSILLGLDLIEDESIGTMATDGKSIIYSPEFTLSMKVRPNKRSLNSRGSSRCLGTPYTKV